MLTVYPWQQRQWEQIMSARAGNRLPHAILLTGVEGAGLTRFANCLVATLLCTQPDMTGTPCGVCKSCILHNAGTHPDILRLEPEEKGKQIKVDAVRDLIDYIHLKSQYGRHKLAVIDPAQAMNRSSANSLLKTLEEPPPGSLIILVSCQPARLPITIRSRCQQINIVAAAGQALAWLDSQTDVHNQPELTELLELNRAGPLKTLELLEGDFLQQQAVVLEDLHALRRKQADPAKIAAKWEDIGALEVSQWLLAVFNRMIRLKLAGTGGQGNKPSINRQLQQLINGLDLAQLFICYDLILRNQHAMTGQISLNKLGLLEDIICQWQLLTE